MRITEESGGIVVGDLVATVSDQLLITLRRHHGHLLRCDRQTTGDLDGYEVETLSLRCEDCGEVILEGIQRLLKRAKAPTRGGRESVGGAKAR
jgi:hypothetical protein